MLKVKLNSKNQEFIKIKINVSVFPSRSEINRLLSSLFVVAVVTELIT